MKYKCCVKLNVNMNVVKIFVCAIIVMFFGNANAQTADTTIARMLIGKWTAVNVKIETKGKIDDETKSMIQQTNVTTLRLICTCLKKTLIHAVNFS